jgi:CheY-like chemotaxis protein
MILYVDDESINLKLFEMMFNEKYNVITAKSATEALGIIERNDEIKVVITDLSMPGLDGIEFAVKAKTINNDIPYFLLSGYGLNEVISDALDNKLFEGYFQKPIKRDKMEKEFDRFIKIK